MFPDSVIGFKGSGSKEIFFVNSAQLLAQSLIGKVTIHAVDDRPLMKSLNKFVNKLYIFDQPYNKHIKYKHLTRIKSLMDLINN